MIKCNIHQIIYHLLYNIQNFEAALLSFPKERRYVKIPWFFFCFIKGNIRGSLFDLVV